jgi:hypothetical protein
MSTYQYYEFQTIDRPLTPQEQETIKQLSSRAEVTPHKATFLYNYGDFRGTPDELVAKYFDVMFYIANWGTWQLIFRFPKQLVNPQWFSPYELEDAIEITTTAEYLVLSITIQEEGGIGWVEGEGWLPRLLPLRDDLLVGDLRLLYLTWLRVAPHLADYGDDDDPTEPPVPGNLGQLAPHLTAFVELVELDTDLVAAAAKASAQHKTTQVGPSLADWLPELSEAERQEFLLKLVRREPHVDLQLINRLKELAGVGQVSAQVVPGKRTYSELAAIADGMEAQRKSKEAAAARKQRVKQLEALAPREAQTWDRVMDLIQVKQSYAYDEATQLLRDLRDLAEHQGRLPEFSRRFDRLKENYSNRPALQRRLKAF